jgi:hypothetical protein
MSATNDATFSDAGFDTSIGGDGASLVDGAKATATKFANSAADSFKSAVEGQKTAGAAAIGDLARSAKGAADGFQEQAPELASAVRSVADRVEGISNDIRDRSLNDLMGSVADFAGERPIAFFGCGLLAGLVVARLLASPRQ